MISSIEFERRREIFSDVSFQTEPQLSTRFLPASDAPPFRSEMREFPSTESTKSNCVIDRRDNGGTQPGFIKKHNGRFEGGTQSSVTCRRLLAPKEQVPKGPVAARYYITHELSSLSR